MNIKHLKAGALLMAAALLTSSCVGSFSLFNKLASWNKNATGNKFLNELIFIVISPAYAIVGTVDVLVLNSIEFWTGDNPVANNVGKTKNVVGSDGRSYAVTTLKDGYRVVGPDGNVVRYNYDKKTQTWSLEGNGESRELVRINPDGTVRATLPNGETLTVTQDEASLQLVREHAAGIAWAMR
jgi:hypothetical protein